MQHYIQSSLGLIAGLFFAYCGLPQAIKTLRQNKHLGTPISISGSITIGTVLMYLYLYLSYGFDKIITINYTVEFLSWLVLFVYGLKSMGNKE